MHVYKETNDEIKKLPETLFLLKNYAVVFISYTHVCKFILQNPNLFIKRDIVTKNRCFHTSVEVYEQMKSNFTAIPMTVLDQLTNAFVKEILLMTTQW